MYYMMRFSPKERFGIIGTPELPSSVSFTAGRVIPKGVPKPIIFPVDTTAKNPPGDYLEFNIPVLSNRLLAAVTEAGVDNLQAFPALLRNSDTGEEWDGYQGINFLGLISCLAVAESKAKSSLPPLYSFNIGEMVIEESRADGALAFRLAESPAVLLVHKRLRDHLKHATPEFRGLKFRKVGSV
jgi:hypothetical protein